MRFGTQPITRPNLSLIILERTDTPDPCSFSFLCQAEHFRFYGAEEHFVWFQRAPVAWKWFAMHVRYSVISSIIQSNSLIIIVIGQFIHLFIDISSHSFSRSKKVKCVCSLAKSLNLDECFFFPQVTTPLHFAGNEMGTHELISINVQYMNNISVLLGNSFSPKMFQCNQNHQLYKNPRFVFTLTDCLLPPVCFSSSTESSHFIVRQSEFLGAMKKCFAFPSLRGECEFQCWRIS